MDMERSSRANGTRPHNRLLQRMPEEQYKSLARLLIPIDLPMGMQLSAPHQPVDYLYFPVSGLVSIDAMTTRGECVQVCVVGREGLAGSCGLLGHRMMGHSVRMQCAGSGLRIRLGPVRDEFVKGGAFAQIIHTALYLQMVQISQSVLCNRLHAVEQRMARWMLSAADLTQTEVLQLTQEDLAQMLGSRRSTVTVAAGLLQGQGCIEYTRGRVRIVNRTGLEDCACECYAIVRNAYNELVGRDY